MCKTFNYNIQLMSPLQTNKEILFNESMSKIDSICNYAITDFITSVSNPPLDNNRYILSEEPYKNCISYNDNLHGIWQYISPQENMIIFVIKHNCFFLFQDSVWKKI